MASLSRSLVLNVDAQGNVRLEDPQAFQHAGLHPGRYRLTPAASDLFLLRRTTSDLTEEERILVAGEIGATSHLGEVIQLVYALKWSGAFTLLQEGTARTLYFHQGNVRSVASTRSDERIESVLYRFGIAERTDLERAAAEAGAQKSLARVLVEQGIVSGADLYASLRRQAEEILHALLQAPDGVFVFRCHTPRARGPLNLDTQNLLFEVARRLDEMKYFRAKIPSCATVLAQRPIEPQNDLDEHEAQVLILCDGQRDLDAIGRETRLGEFEVTKCAYHLLEAGLVEIVTAPATEIKEAAPSIPSHAAFDALLEAYQPLFARTLRAAVAKGREVALRSDLEAFFRGSTGLAELFRGVDVAANGALGRERLLANLAAIRSARKVELLQQGLSEFLYFMLFSAMEELDRGSEQELERRVQEILRDATRSV